MLGLASWCTAHQYWYLPKPHDCGQQLRRIEGQNGEAALGICERDVTMLKQALLGYVSHTRRAKNSFSVSREILISRVMLAPRPTFSNALSCSDMLMYSVLNALRCPEIHLFATRCPLVVSHLQTLLQY